MNGSEVVMSGVDRETERRANELYWGSQLSVNQIAEELDVSKGMLYGLIRPRLSGLPCPECSEELVHANRTARDKGLVACARCGWEGAEEETDAPPTTGTGVLPLGEPDPSEEPPPRPADPGRRRALIGGALLGAAAGLALVLWKRRR